MKINRLLDIDVLSSAGVPVFSNKGNGGGISLLDDYSLNGRDTERDLFDCSGGYKTKLSKNTVDKPCHICENIIKKEAYIFVVNARNIRNN